MGNCQASEAVAVVIQHPTNKVERIYCSVSAHEVMNSNPGHYVALVVASPTAKSGDGVPVKQVKLLRPDDTLLIGQVYRLISFEDVLKEFSAKKSVKQGKLLEGEDLGPEKKKKFAGTPGLNQNPSPDNCPSVQMKQLGSSSRPGIVGSHYVVGQWKPALQTIAEVGT